MFDDPQCEILGGIGGDVVAGEDVQQVLLIGIWPGCAVDGGGAIAAYDILGCAFLGMADCTTAYQCLLQAIRIAYQIQSWDLLTRSLVNMAEVHLAQEEPEAAKDLLEAALSHPSTLFEYGLKAVDLLDQIGGKSPEEKDAGVLLDVVKRHFDLRPAGF